jgi:hypothetical protein
LPQFLIDPPNCGATYTIDLVFLVNGVVTPKPSFIEIDAVNFTPPQLAINLSDPNCILGVYEFEFVGTVVGTQTVTGGLKKAAPFTFMRYDNCFEAVLESPLPKMLYYEIGT